MTGKQVHVVRYVDQFALLERYRAGTYAVLDGAGHNSQLDQPAAVSQLLRAWAHQVRGPLRVG